MPRTGSLSAAAGFVNPPGINADLVPPTANTGRLSGVVASCMRISDALLAVVIDMTARKVRAKAASGAHDADIIAIRVHEDTLVGRTFTKLDLTKASSPWSTGDTEFTIGAGGANAWQDLLKPVVPEITTFQLIDAIEDALIALGGPLEGVPTLVTMDQADGTFWVNTFATAGEAAAIVAAFPATIGYDQTLTAPGSTPRQALE